MPYQDERVDAIEGHPPPGRSAGGYWRFRRPWGYADFPHTMNNPMTKHRHAGRSAARTRASVASAPGLSRRLRILVTVLALIALAIQVFGVQGHVHRLPTAGSSQGTGLQVLLAGEQAHSTIAPHHTAPGDDDPAKCPFCQQLGNSQQLVAYSLLLFSFCCFAIIRSVATRESAPALLAVRHAWQSRAPPRQ
jgi:hypothetical protein